MLTRLIPSTGEAIPVIGLGTWKSFYVGGDAETLTAAWAGAFPGITTYFVQRAWPSDDPGSG